MNASVCQNCSVNPATIHYTEIKEEERIELHLCEECASTEGLSLPNGPAGVFPGLVLAAERPGEVRECPHCGITFKEFRRKGRLGCPQDYDVFAEILQPLIGKMHAGAERHTGRVPGGRRQGDGERHHSLQALRRDLKSAIDGEQFEEAARLRDRIKDLETERGSV